VHRKEFIAKYPSVPTAKYTKSWKTIRKLEREGRLDIFAYCDVMVREVDIARFSGLSLKCIGNYKLPDSKLPFMYAELREKSVKSLVLEFEKDLS